MPIYRPQWPSFSASRRRVSNHRLPPPPCFCRRLLPLRAGGDEPKVTREYKEGDAKFTVNSEPAPSEPSSNPNSVYADQLPEPKREEMSPEMKARLKREYYGLGGSPNTKMGGNYFLYIILGIAFLAVLSALTGAI